MKTTPADIPRAALAHTADLAHEQLQFAQRRYAEARRRLAEYDAQANTKSLFDGARK